MHPTDLFDMIAGTSIGSITAAGLSIPQDDNATSPKFYAANMRDIMTGQADVLFQRSSIGWFYQVLSYIVLLALFTGSFHLWGRYKYQNKKVMSAHKEMLEFLRHRKL